MTRSPQGRPRKLTPEQQQQAKARYYLWRANTPQRIANDLGISVDTLRHYVMPLGKYARW